MLGTLIRVTFSGWELDESLEEAARRETLEVAVIIHNLCLWFSTTAKTVWTGSRSGDHTRPSNRCYFIAIPLFFCSILYFRTRLIRAFTAFGLAGWFQADAHGTKVTQKPCSHRSIPPPTRAAVTRSAYALDNTCWESPSACSGGALCRLHFFCYVFRRPRA